MKRRTLFDYGLVAVVSVLVALLVQAYLVKPYRIPSESMAATLKPGDRVLVNRVVYHLRQPKRGDVVVFKLPRDNTTDYIKRVIGLPGDEIQMIHGVLHINGQEVKKERIDDFVQLDAKGREHHVPRYRETLPNGVTYPVLDLTQDSIGDNTEVYKVPEGHFFMMGDNRDNSTDSRFLSEVGFVPFENLVGKAKLIFFSIDDDASFLQVWKWPASVRWSRIFDMVH